MERHRIKGLAALAALGLMAAACTGGSTPQPDAAGIETGMPATSAGPTASPASTAPSGVATGPSEEGSAAAVLGDPRPAPELVGLVRSDGSPFDLASLQGSNVLIFFGYTHCPDVCPTTLGEIYQVFAQEPETRAVFVSVDPERDTPGFLEEWTTYLPENLIAVTGTPGAIRRAADGYGVKYARVETTSKAGYTMSHTADLYLIDKDGRYLLAYPFGTAAEQIVADLARLSAG